MFNVGAGELILILVLALLILGPQRLPELARGIGKFMREFRRQTDEVRNVVEREFYKMDQELETAMLPDQNGPPSQPPEGSVPADGQPAPQAQPVDPSFATTQQNEAIGAPPAENEVIDESDPRHPDYFKEQQGPPPEEPVTVVAEPPPDATPANGAPANGAAGDPPTEPNPVLPPRQS